MVKCSTTFLFNKCIETVKFYKRFYWHRQGYRPQNIEPGSYPFPRKQVPVAGLKSYEERFKGRFPHLVCQSLEISGSLKNDEVTRINIGFEYDAPKRVHKPVRRIELEPLARRGKLRLSTEEIHNPEEDRESPLRRYLAADHYGIFTDLFGPHYFTPVVDVSIFFPLGNSSNVIPVYHGNHISPEHTQVLLFFCFLSLFLLK